MEEKTQKSTGGWPKGVSRRGITPALQKPKVQIANYELAQMLHGIAQNISHAYGLRKPDNWSVLSKQALKVWRFTASTMSKNTGDAKKAHEIWSAEMHRIGLVWGPYINYIRGTHMWLKPYSELTPEDATLWNTMAYVTDQFGDRVKLEIDAEDDDCE